MLDTVLANRAELERNLGDRDALRSARRQFHTLKGSGRMVGLERARRARVRRGEDSQPPARGRRDVTPACCDLLEVAEANFRRWVGALKDKGDVYADPADCMPRSARRGGVAGRLESDGARAAPVVARPAGRNRPVAVAPPRNRRRPVEAEAPAPDFVPGTGADRGRGGGGAGRVDWPAEEDEDAGAEIIEFAPRRRDARRCRRRTTRPPPADVVRSAKSRCRRISMR